TNSFGIEGSLDTVRSSFLALFGIIRLLGVGYAPHTELRTGSVVRANPKKSGDFHNQSTHDRTSDYRPLAVIIVTDWLSYAPFSRRKYRRRRADRGLPNLAPPSPRRTHPSRPIPATSPDVSADFPPP